MLCRNVPCLNSGVTDKYMELVLERVLFSTFVGRCISFNEATKKYGHVHQVGPSGDDGGGGGWLYFTTFASRLSGSAVQRVEARRPRGVRLVPT